MDLSISENKGEAVTQGWHSWESMVAWLGLWNYLDGEEEKEMSICIWCGTEHDCKAIKKAHAEWDSLRSKLAAADKENAELRAELESAKRNIPNNDMLGFQARAERAESALAAYRQGDVAADAMRNDLEMTVRHLALVQDSARRGWEKVKDLEEENKLVYERRDAMAKDLEEAEVKLANHDGAIRALGKSYDGLKAKMERCREGFKKYARHKQNCIQMTGQSCSCGFDVVASFPPWENQ